MGRREGRKRDVGWRDEGRKETGREKWDGRRWRRNGRGQEPGRGNGKNPAKRARKCAAAEANDGSKRRSEERRRSRRADASRQFGGGRCGFGRAWRARGAVGVGWGCGRETHRREESGATVRRRLRAGGWSRAAGGIAEDGKAGSSERGAGSRGLGAGKTEVGRPRSESATFPSRRPPLSRGDRDGRKAEDGRAKTREAWSGELGAGAGREASGRRPNFGKTEMRPAARFSRRAESATPPGLRPLLSRGDPDGRRAEDGRAVNGGGRWPRAGDTPWEAVGGRERATTREAWSGELGAEARGQIPAAGAEVGRRRSDFGKAENRPSARFARRAAAATHPGLRPPLLRGDPDADEWGADAVAPSPLPVVGES